MEQVNKLTEGHYSLQVLKPSAKIPGNLKKRQAKQKIHGWSQGHPTVQLPKYMRRTEETIQQEKSIQKSHTWEELREMRIKKLRTKIDFSIDKMVSCHIPMATVTADMGIFKGGNIANCFEKWANITQGQFVLNIVKFGLTMELAE